MRAFSPSITDGAITITEVTSTPEEEELTFKDRHMLISNVGANSCAIALTSTDELPESPCLIPVLANSQILIKREPEHKYLFAFAGAETTTTLIITPGRGF